MVAIAFLYAAMVAAPWAAAFAAIFIVAKKLAAKKEQVQRMRGYRVR